MLSWPCDALSWTHSPRLQPAAVQLRLVTRCQLQYDQVRFACVLVTRCHLPSVQTLVAGTETALARWPPFSPVVAAASVLAPTAAELWLEASFACSSDARCLFGLLSSLLASASWS